jgi:segregation and condensation protein B
MDPKFVIESILLVSGEPVSEARLTKILKAKPEKVRAALSELGKDYETRGIRLSEANGDWQLVTAPENSSVIEDLIKSEFSEELSKAALETLSVIAYKGPLTRAEIEYIRGVNSSFTVRNLLLRGLVERVDNPKDARSYLYRVTLDFLHHIGLSRREELPEWEAYHATPISISEESNENS